MNKQIGLWIDLEIKGLSDKVVRVGTADKMTDRQIAAEVRQHLQIKKAQLDR
jgi:hypothetical protein